MRPAYAAKQLKSGIQQRIGPAGIVSPPKWRYAFLIIAILAHPKGTMGKKSDTY
jgi:hypothetical protein